MLPPPVSRRVADSPTQSNHPCPQGVSWGLSALLKAMELCDFRHRGSFLRIPFVRLPSLTVIAPRRLGTRPGDWLTGWKVPSCLLACPPDRGKIPAEVGPYLLASGPLPVAWNSLVWARSGTRVSLITARNRGWVTLILCFTCHVIIRQCCPPPPMSKMPWVNLEFHYGLNVAHGSGFEQASKIKNVQLQCQHFDALSFLWCTLLCIIDNY